MDTAFLAGIAGLASGGLGVLASRFPGLGWIALVPLGAALARCGAWASLSGALVGASLHGFAQRGQPPPLRWLGARVGAVSWGLASCLGGLALAYLPKVMLLVVLPVAVALAALPMRAAGTPRWIHAPLACSQEPWPAVLRAGWIGGEQAVSSLLAVTGAAGALLSVEPSMRLVPGAALAFVALALWGSYRSLRRLRAAIDQAPRVRVAVVVVDGQTDGNDPGDPLAPARAPAYRDVEATVARYSQHIVAVARRGACVVVLPEVAVVIDDGTRTAWDAATRRWASELGITLVAPRLDLAAPSNSVEIIQPSGRSWVHDKQHPAPGLEPPRRTAEPPGPHPLASGFALSTPICVDLDYPDVIPAARRGGLLVVPANDWPQGGFHELHDRTAVWAAVLGGAPVIRATGHGISSVRDGAGRLLARASSLEGPAVLVVDVPLLRAGPSTSSAERPE